MTYTALCGTAGQNGKIVGPPPSAFSGKRHAANMKPNTRRLRSALAAERGRPRMSADDQQKLQARTRDRTLGDEALMAIVVGA